MARAAIEIENLSKEYPFGFLHLKKKTSLEGLTMSVEDGEVFGFLGPNGAGKSTTIKLLVGLIFPTAGTARILGKSISDISMHADIGYLPEQPYFYDYLTAAELLDYFARFHDLPAQERKVRVERMLKKVGLETAGKIQLRKYSKGMLQRVGLAQAILHDPKVVILDEPMSGLDPVGRREVRDIILELKRDGKTVMFSTHILSDAEMLCDRVGVIVGGKLRGVGAPGTLVDMKTQGMEILFELRGTSNAPLLSKATRMGDCYRLQVAEEELYAAIEQLRAAGARILSVSQVKATLEEFFMNLVVVVNTFREAVRDRVLYNLVFFALLMMAAAIGVGQISVGIEQTVIVSLGLSAISVIGLLISIFIGVALVSKEMDKRTLYALLAKPVRRWEFLLGKFAGLVLTLAVNTAAMALGLLLVMIYMKHSLERSDAVALVAVYFILLKLALIVALALLFSCFTTPLLAILFTVGLYIVGLYVQELRNLPVEVMSPAMSAFTKWLSYLLPNFENFNVMAMAAHGRAVPGALILQNTLYTVVYCTIVLTAAAVVFSRRDLK